MKWIGKLQVIIDLIVLIARAASAAVKAFGDTIRNG